METFKNNFSKLLLLSGSDIRFYNDKKEFFMRIPTFYDFYSSEDLLSMLNYLDQDIKEINKIFNIKDLTSHYDFFKILFPLAEKIDQLKPIRRSLFNAMKIILPKFYFNNIMYIEEGTILTQKLFEEITEILFISIGNEKTIIKKEDDEFTRIQKQAKLRAEKIRASAKKEEGTVENFQSVKDMLVSILYEFPQYKLKDLFDLNIFTIHSLFGYVGKIANYEVSKIAAGNGLAKKHKYFIEK